LPIESSKPEVGGQQRGPMASVISDGIVQLHAQFYGRGPTKAKTYLWDDYALCVLEDVLTTAERTLVRSGRSSHVRSTRLSFQDVMRDDFISAVEKATSRKVRAFMSAIHVEPEIATELFLFEPADGHAGS
jgi:uncharacterized protein YbcI